MNGTSKLIKGTALALTIVITGFIWISISPESAHYLIAVIAVFLMVYGVKGIWPYHSSKNWIECDSVVRSIGEKYEEVAISDAQRMKYFYPEIEYNYTYKGEEYTSNIVSFDIENIWVPEFDLLGGDIKAEERFWFLLKENSSMKIFVNSSDPKDSVIVKQLSSKRRLHYLSLILSGLILLIVWGSLNYGSTINGVRLD